MSVTALSAICSTLANLSPNIPGAGVPYPKLITTAESPELRK